MMPKLFLIGAPKCGTTSLAAWLDGHPDIFMCKPKEPDYYATDVASSIEVVSPQSYRALFARARLDQVCGEASTTYLRSRVAVPAILHDVPYARLVVCLRHPVDLAESMHRQLLRSGRESEPNFKRAWALQQTRRSTPTVRTPDHNPNDLLYGDMAKLGAQVARLLNVAPRQQVTFVFLEDMQRDPASVYRSVLAHAGVPDDGRREFPVLNEKRMPRSLALARATRLFGAMRRRFGVIRGTGLGRAVGRLNETTPPSTYDPKFRKHLIEYFRTDIRLLEKMTERNLEHWLD